MSAEIDLDAVADEAEEMLRKLLKEAGKEATFDRDQFRAKIKKQLTEKLAKVSDSKGGAAGGAKAWEAELTRVLAAR